MTKHRKNLTSVDDLDVLEAHLAGTLKPVLPPKDIVQRLRERMQVPDGSEIALRLTDWRRMFIVFGGVISGLLVLITFARAFYYLAGRRGGM